jgi:hypothetical protein
LRRRQHCGVSWPIEAPTVPRQPLSTMSRPLGSLDPRAGRLPGTARVVGEPVVGRTSAVSDIGEPPACPCRAVGGVLDEEHAAIRPPARFPHADEAVLSLDATCCRTGPSACRRAARAEALGLDGCREVRRYVDVWMPKLGFTYDHVTLIDGLRERRSLPRPRAGSPLIVLARMAARPQIARASSIRRTSSSSRATSSSRHLKDEAGSYPTLYGRNGRCHPRPRAWLTSRPRTTRRPDHRVRGPARLRGQPVLPHRGVQTPTPRGGRPARDEARHVGRRQPRRRRLQAGQDRPGHMQLFGDDTGTVPPDTTVLGDQVPRQPAPPELGALPLEDAGDLVVVESQRAAEGATTRAARPWPSRLGQQRRAVARFGHVVPLAAVEFAIARCRTVPTTGFAAGNSQSTPLRTRRCEWTEQRLRSDAARSAERWSSRRPVTMRSSRHSRARGARVAPGGTWVATCATELPRSRCRTDRRRCRGHG